MPAVAVIEQRREFGASKSNQVIIWESLMDAKTILLTPNTETVYGLGFLYLKEDGPTVCEAPPQMLGLAMDTLQRYLVDIGMRVRTKARAANICSCHLISQARLLRATSS